MKPLIVALDVETDKEAIALVKELKPHVDLFKVGPVLFFEIRRRTSSARSAPSAPRSFSRY